jgi:membrane-associated phospholipid phosphatase
MAEGTANPDALRRLDRAIWALVVMVAATVLLAPLVSDFTIEWRTFAKPVSAGLVLMAGTWFYLRRRDDPRLASGLHCTAQLVIFAAVGAPLSYLAAGLGAAVPLQDPVLDAIDKALGFDWMALFRWLSDTPKTFLGLRLIYGSLLPQLAVAVLCLAFTGRTLWLRTIMLAFILTTLVTIAISAALPAAGVWLHYGLSEADTRIVPAVRTVWPVFTGLRDGSVRTLVALGAEGIITFPSLHAALAVIMVAALWPIAALRWPVLALNAVMLVSTPVDGAHYLVDILAGIGTAVVCILGARAMTIRAGNAASPLVTSEIPQLAVRD